MDNTQTNNPLHGVALEMIITRLESRFGWADLGRLININCFANDSGIRYSLKFLLKTLWAREKMEALYLRNPDDGK